MHQVLPIRMQGDLAMVQVHDLNAQTQTQAMPIHLTRVGRITSVKPLERTS
jgi:hypothetical protein